MLRGDEIMSEPLKILIVDDQPGVRYLLDILIREAGHRVYTARNGLEAVEAAKSSYPDLIFMDVRMPLMGGLEALSKIKTMMPKTKVIIMTAYGSEETVTRAMEGGALCCIAKPFDVEKIKELLADLEWKHSQYKEALARDYA
jgi:two-component system response regulator (stage 0 sporulation protein F)